MACESENQKDIRNMKIGILTFHCAHNYGAVLQCYALQETLRGMGHDVEVIDYRPYYLKKPYSWFDIHRFISKNPFKALHKSIKEIILLKSRYKRYTAFENFIKYNLNLSEEVCVDKISSKYDIYIMGSDQIWNPKITHGFDPVFFGNFKFIKGKKKYIAYAASMEAKFLKDQEVKYYTKALENFDAIGVRELQLAHLLQPLTDTFIETVLDPTLLADTTIWDKIVENPNIGQKYVLLYQARINSNANRIAEEIAKQINAIVIEVTIDVSTNSNKNILQCVSPEKFLGLIKNAACVVTVSFHGTAFSVIFKKDFYCIELGDGRDTRAQSLLSSINLENRLIKKLDSPIFSKIDYTEEIDSKLLQMRDKSVKFITNAING